MLERQLAWYPGHMAKAARRIAEYLQAIDVVVEVIDARIAQSGRNPLLARLAGRRMRVIVLNRADLADPPTTSRWLRRFEQHGSRAVAVDGRVPRSVTRIAGLIARSTGGERRARGVRRAMVLGIPNAGKSSIVNALLERASAKTEFRPGVTRHAQWFRLSPGVELMDTPGVLAPKVSDARAQWKLALCTAVPNERYDPQEVAAAFHRWLREHSPRTPVPDLAAFAASRGFMRRGGEIDYHTAAVSYIRAFNAGAFGRISLEAPDDAQAT